MEAHRIANRLPLGELRAAHKHGSAQPGGHVHTAGHCIVLHSATASAVVSTLQNNLSSLFPAENREIGPGARSLRSLLLNRLSFAAERFHLSLHSLETRIKKVGWAPESSETGPSSHIDQRLEPEETPERYEYDQPSGPEMLDGPGADGDIGSPYMNDGLELQRYLSLACQTC